MSVGTIDRRSLGVPEGGCMEHCDVVRNSVIKNKTTHFNIICVNMLLCLPISASPPRLSCARLRPRRVSRYLARRRAHFQTAHLPRVGRVPPWNRRNPFTHGGGACRGVCQRGYDPPAALPRPSVRPSLFPFGVVLSSDPCRYSRPRRVLRWGRHTFQQRSARNGSHSRC